jgi:eukaryotic-like serine/threonine-protein kinase
MKSTNPLTIVEDLVQRALELPADQRADFVKASCDDPDLCAQALKLLSADDAATVQFGRALDASLPGDGDTDAIIGRRIGGFRIIDKLGEGGMGVVFLAEREDQGFEQQVAIKLVGSALGNEARRRFETERQILANLNHPNIAHLLGGGTSDEGQAYIVMEYVEGEPIDRFCDRLRLDVDQRIDLFIKVAAAVQHAHRHLVVHRDIKPGNVLVTTNGEPKLLDFGIARVLDPIHGQQRPATRMMALTPEYASPEQIRGEPVTTASDVYALGLLLYELLTGAKGQELSGTRAGEAERKITSLVPDNPSTAVQRLPPSHSPLTTVAERRRTTSRALARRLAGDLDAICMLCLRKEPEERYRSVAGLLDDLQAHRDGLPIKAAGTSGWYRAGKFVRRNTLAVGAGAVIALLILSATLTLALVNAELVEQRNRALIAEQAAEERAEALARVSDFQTEQLGALDPQAFGLRIRDGLLEQLGEGPTAHETAVEASMIDQVNFTDLALTTLDRGLFDHTATAIDQGFPDQPLLRASLLQSFAASLRKVGLHGRAETAQLEALTIRSQHLGDNHPDTLTSRHALGLLRNDQGQIDEALSLLEAVSQGRLEQLGETHPTTLESVQSLALVHVARSDLEQAKSLLEDLLARQRELFGDEHPTTISVLSNLAGVLLRQGEIVTARPLLYDALAASRRVHGEEHLRTIDGLSNIGATYQMERNFEQAEPYTRQALERYRRVLGRNHMRTLRTQSNLAALYRRQGRLVEAKELQIDALEGMRANIGPNHPDTLGTQHNVGLALWTLGEIDRARDYMEGARQAFIELSGADHYGAVNAAINLARLEVEQQRFEQATVALMESWESLAASPPNSRARSTAAELVEVYVAWHEAEPDAGHQARAEFWAAEDERLEKQLKSEAMGE